MSVERSHITAEGEREYKIYDFVKLYHVRHALKSILKVAVAVYTLALLAVPAGTTFLLIQLLQDTDLFYHNTTQTSLCGCISSLR